MGSKVGWIIGGATVAIMVAVVLVAVLAGGRGPELPPGSLDQGDLAKIAMPQMPTDGHADIASKAGNGGEPLKEAIRLLNAEIERQRREFEPVRRSVLDEAARLVMEAGEYQSINIHEPPFDPIADGLQIHRYTDVTTDIRQLAAFLNNQQLYYAQNDEKDKAIKLNWALYHIGNELRANAKRVSEYLVGNSLLHDSTFYLVGLGEMDKAQADDLREANKMFRRSTAEKFDRLVSVNADANESLSDVMLVAKSDEDPVFRVEAILTLGYLLTRLNDQRLVEMVQTTLDEIQAEGDELIVTAVKRARGIDEDEVAGFINEGFAMRHVDGLLPK